jgi:hypothetical protein
MLLFLSRIYNQDRNLSSECLNKLYCERVLLFLQASFGPLSSEVLSLAPSLVLGEVCSRKGRLDDP